MGPRSSQHACIILIVVTYLVEVSQAQNCEAGWYGSDCEYKCHCVNSQCYTSGQCSGTALCEHGWFGPGCQYEDLTLKARIQLTFPGESVQVTDVKHDTCLWDPAAPGLKNVTFTFGIAYPFTWFRAVFNRSGSNDEALQVTFGQTNNGGSSTKLDCMNRTQFVISETILDIHCHVMEPAKQIILSGPGIESLCSFHISGGRNVALKQNTSQSSTYYSKWQNAQLVSSYAVDGDARASGQDRTCTHTNKDSENFWKVDLSQPEMVTRYVVYNRDDANLDRLKGFVLKSLDLNGSQLFRHQDMASKAQKVYTIIVPSSTEQEPVSSVVITKYNEFLTLCQVELYSECPLGTYGINCQETCRAACDGGSCEPVKGYCHHCPAGKQGLYCGEDCDNSHYGPNCEHSCSRTCEDERCDPVTGHCISCPPGKRGELCYQVCTNKTYGVACGQVCSSHCRMDQLVEPAVCHPTTGTCLLGCQAGYQGLTCTEEISYLGVGTVIGLDILFMCILVAAAAAGWYYWQKRKAAQGKPKHNYDALDQERGESEPRESYAVTFSSLRSAEERADERADVRTEVGAEERAEEKAEERAEERAESPAPSKEESEDGDTYEEVAQPLLSRSAPVATSAAPPQGKEPPPPSELAPPPPVQGAGNGGYLAPMGYDQVPKHPKGSKKMAKDAAQEEEDGEQLYENL